MRIVEVPKGWKEIIFYEPYDIGIDGTNSNREIKPGQTTQGRIILKHRRTALALVEWPDYPMQTRHVVVSWIGTDSRDQFSRKLARQIARGRAVDRLFGIKFERKGEHPFRTLEFLVGGDTFAVVRQQIAEALLREGCLRVLPFEPKERN